ncbi:MAG: hypothetical protein FD170_3740 [Bacteroidetes bacterium]|nr:MAG: hypothetical protein FD170_3740 [Bacteroidota bacterium]
MIMRLPSVSSPSWAVRFLPRKNGFGMTALRGIWKGRRPWRLRDYEIPPSPVFTDKPVIPNGTTWSEESAKLVARTEQTSNTQQ